MKLNNNNNNNNMKKKNAKNKNFVSPYQQAGSILNQVWSNSNNNNGRISSGPGSLKSVVYDASTGSLKCSASTYAICAKVLASQAILQSVLERAAEAAAENEEDGKQTSILGSNGDIQNEGLFHVLLYELLLGPNKAIRGGGALKRQILQQETILRSALADIRKETPTTTTSSSSSSSSLKEQQEQMPPPPFPRYVRVNTLRTTTSRALATWRQEQQHVGQEKTKSGSNNNDSISNEKLVFYQDVHVPDLFVFPHSATRNVLSSSLARNHDIVLQDKSSCFPALCLVHGFDEYSSTDTHRQRRRVYLDACAAPGNKTSHLAALALSSAATTHTTKQHRHTDDDKDENHDNNDDTFPIQVYALDRSKDRCEALKRRMKQLLPDSIDRVQIHAQCHDFLSLGRPVQEDKNDINNKKQSNKKSKEKNDDDHDARAMVQVVTDILLDPSCSGSGIFHRSNDPNYEGDSHDQTDASSHRLQSLSNFQTTALRHALTNFENAQRVVYSTCSIHEQENEGVVADVLNDANVAAKWQLVAPTCLRDWQRRGRQEQKGKKDDKKSSSSISCLTKEQLATLIRADRDDETNGFFVACFARKHEDQATSSSSSHAARENKKKKAKLAHATNVASVEPIPNVPFYSGQFKTIANQENKDKTTESSSKKKDQAPLNKTDAKTSPSPSSRAASVKKRKSESTAEESNNKSMHNNKDHEEEDHQNNQKKTKNTEDKPSPQKESDTSTSTSRTKRPKKKQKEDADHDEHPEKPLPKKVVKKLEWKRRQRQSKVQRLHSKQKPQKS